MPSASATASERAGWLGPALAVVGAVTALRILLLAFNRADLFVDETQYWFWGQELAFGYYSKPPLIGWVIRAFTTLAGSDGQFWVRLPGPLFHGATALLLGAVAARLYGRRAAVWVAAGYITLPMVALASLTISTDTIMFPFLALALLLWLRLGERPAPDRRHETGLALACGLALGLGFMAKYAAVYYLICAGIAALVAPALRPSRRAAGLGLLAFLLTLSPNVIWNALMGFPTLYHTEHNIGWVKAPAKRAGLHWDKLAEFLANQFAVVGPVVFALLLLIALRALGPGRRGHLGQKGRLLLAFSLPILAIICVQALLSRAYANWAAAAYLAGTVLVFARAGRFPKLAAIAINAAVCLALPAMTIWPEAVVMRDGRYAMHRYLGRAALSDWIIAEAQKVGVSTVVASRRDILADLFYSGRDSGLRFYSTDPDGPPQDHYELTHPFPDEMTGEVLLVQTGEGQLACDPDEKPQAETTPQVGAYRGLRIALYKVPARCARDED
ncbi:ArnT family glycosyltransferase [Acidimangrovimonas pyrenivorans]|uniref:ArnT family glycosyltransferase n=1 Tax=Acidimangrovimonas pyrenivorans TaxID=2030798 RepID=A0ABV7AF61_9RHOB